MKQIINNVIYFQLKKPGKIMTIRLERDQDYFKVETMVRNAFWNVYRPGAFEHFIVHNLRNHDSFIKDLSYVIEKEGEIIGYICYSNGTVRYENGKTQNAVVLGPVAIDEKFQNEGYGSQLIEFTLSLAEKNDISCVFVVGDENYYSRFGFESASKYNIYLDGTDQTELNPFFMIRIFDENEMSKEFGIFRNPDVFDVDGDEVDEFDRQFEFRKKLVLDGQLGV